MLINVAAKLKKRRIKQIERFNLRSNRISFNSAAALLTPLTFADINLKVKHFCG
jgi:hypothetical protein